MSERVYKIDKFVVPVAAREEFSDRVRLAHAFLKTQSGFLQDFVLEQSSGPGEFNVVTIVEWASEEAFENAGAAVAARYREMNFNPQDTLARLGIKADFANYKRLESTTLSQGHPI
jgi:heme-degrading monooxygenase HmoA